MSDEWKRAAVVGVIGLVTALWFACSRPIANVALVMQPTRQVADDLGRSVIVPVPITRVVSTAPSVTENIFAVGAGDRLVGVTTFCNYPEGAKAIAKIGDTLNPNVETIVALKPDIVLVSSASQLENFMKILEQNGIAVYVTSPTSLDGVLKNLKQLGELFGTQDAADKLVGDLQRRIDDVEDKCNTENVGEPIPELFPVKVFVQISKEPLFTVGKTSFLNQVIHSVGAQSVTEKVETAYPKLSKETALALNPQAIVLSESPDNQEPNDAFKNSPAVKNGRIYKVSADLLSRPGPRLVDALEQIARDLHPDKFRNN